MSQNSDARAIPRLVEGRIGDIIRVLHYGGIIVFVVMIVLTLSQSIGRYVFNIPIPGSIEISKYLLCTGIFLLFAHTMMKRRHVAIGLLVDKLSERTQAIIDSVTYSLTLVVAFAGVWQSISFGIYYMTKAPLASDVLHIPVYPFFYVMALGWTMFGTATLINVIHFVSRAVKR